MMLKKRSRDQAPEAGVPAPLPVLEAEPVAPPKGRARRLDRDDPDHPENDHPLDLTHSASGHHHPADGHAPHPHDDPDHPDYDPDHPHHHLPRTFQDKMFGIGWTGWVRLGILCVTVGALMTMAEVNPFSPDFSLGGAVSGVIRATMTALTWILANGWWPFFVGILVVGPVWVLWRLITVPFRH